MEKSTSPTGANGDSSTSRSPQITYDNNTKKEHLYKILVIGELGTGKTSIINRYVHQFFSKTYKASTRIGLAGKVLNWDANTLITLLLCEIAGQERFGNMTRVHCKEAVGAFVVFDVSRPATFEAVQKWKNDLDNEVHLPDGSNIPCVLLANKCDLEKEGIINNKAQMKEFCEEHGFAAYVETSAQENTNIDDAAKTLVNMILLNYNNIHMEDSVDGDKLTLPEKAKTKKRLKKHWFKSNS